MNRRSFLFALPWVPAAMVVPAEPKMLPLAREIATALKAGDEFGIYLYPGGVMWVDREYDEALGEALHRR